MSQIVYTYTPNGGGRIDDRTDPAAVADLRRMIEDYERRRHGDDLAGRVARVILDAAIAQFRPDSYAHSTLAQLDARKVAEEVLALFLDELTAPIADGPDDLDPREARE